MEIVHGGWLKKSPPEKRIWRAKWRRRWFVLRQSGQIPGQYVLEYFTDQSCRKLKGHIDLDQCEQVDAGVPLESDSRKCNYVHVFDIRTPKRIYYLVADTEADMNKWVDCICSVCGLRMHVEEDYDAQQMNDATTTATPTMNVLTQPSPTLSNAYETRSRHLARDDSQSLTSLSTCGPSGPYIPISECHSGTNGFLFDSVHSIQDDDDDDDDEAFPDQVPPPPPKTGGCGVTAHTRKKTYSGDFYDYPRQIHPQSLDESTSDFVDRGGGDLDNPFGMIGGGSGIRRLSTEVDEKWSLSSLPLTAATIPPPPPPKVNWETYPHGDNDNIYQNRSASSGNDVYDHPVSSSGNDVYDHPVSSSVVATIDASDKLGRLSMSDSGVEIQRSSSSSPQDSIESTKQDYSIPPPSVVNKSFGNAASSTPKPPPRPPKPKPQHLIESLQCKQQRRRSTNTYDNIEDCEAMLYDVPPSAQGVFLSKNLPANAFAYLKDDSLDSIPTLTTVGSKSNTITVDEMYDFPRPLHEDQLSATPPAPSGEVMWQKRHAYTNAPTSTLQLESYVGVGGSDDASKNGDGDEYLSMDPTQQQRRRSSDVYTDMSLETRSPNNSIYSNVPSPMHKYDNVFVLETPPVVNRKLKPGRKSDTPRKSPQHPIGSHSLSSSISDSPSATCLTPSTTDLKMEAASTTSSHTRATTLGHPPKVNRTLKPKRTSESIEVSFNTLPHHATTTTITLSPPPLGFNHQTNKKRSFRKPKEIPSPNIAAVHRRLLSTSTLNNGTTTAAASTTLFPSGRPPKSDRSSSDDDQSSSCSSRRNSSNDDHTAAKQTQQHLKSPSPSLFGYRRRHEPEIQYLDLDLESDAATALAIAQSPKSPERFTTNTVYKTVDFVKTKAFNEMRQNVEETYRKSQS